MRKLNKRIISLFTALAAAVCLSANVCAADATEETTENLFTIETEIPAISSDDENAEPLAETATPEPVNEIISFNIDTAGICEIVGVNPLGLGHDTTLLMTTKDIRANSDIYLDVDTLIYIDQIPNGNNGVFYFHFPISDKFSGSEYYLYIGGAVGDPYMAHGTLGEFPTLVHRIPDNSIRVGNDVYNMVGADYTPTNIAKSLSVGGNKLYYKIGGKWFNLLNPVIKSSADFKDGNQITDEEWYAWVLDNYFGTSTIK